MFSVKIITADAVSAVIPRPSEEAIVSHLGIVGQHVSKKNKFSLTFLVKVTFNSLRKLSYIHLMRAATSAKVKMLQITQLINTVITVHVCFGALPKG